MKNQSPNPCPGQEETIYLYLDGELTPSERTAFEAHLGACQACQSLLRETETIFADLSALEPVAAPAEIVSEVMAKLPTQKASSHLSPAGQLILAAQVVIGRILLFVGLSRFAAVYSRQLSILAWPSLPEMRGFIALRLAETGGSLAAFFGGYWSQALDVSILNISSTTAIAIVVGLGLAWLAGNALLLNRPAGSLNKRGA